MSTFICRLDEGGDGPRLAVKDLIDMVGVPTTAGCRAVADGAKPADRDAPCLAGARAADARIVGKTNLHELAFGASGINPWFGTPQNPLDAMRVPGGSSSGSAVAVATGEADVAYGSDTGGSVRIPSACCGTTGLKTTHGRISIEGVWPLAQSLDTIGPMARDVAGVALGMQLLEPGFEVAALAPTVVGRFRAPDADPAIDEAVDRALAAAEFEVVDIELPGFDPARGAAATILIAEAWRNDRHLLERRDAIGDNVATMLEIGSAVSEEVLAEAEGARQRWRAELDEMFRRVEVIALPTAPILPPSLEGDDTPLAFFTLAFNLSGSPALALPVPSSGPMPASLQLVGPHNREDVLLAAGKQVEAAV